LVLEIAREAKKNQEGRNKVDKVSNTSFIDVNRKYHPSVQVPGMVLACWFAGLAARRDENQSIEEKEKSECVVWGMKNGG